MKSSGARKFWKNVPSQCSLLIFLDILVTAWALQFTMKVQLVLVLCLQLCGSYRLAKGRLHLKFSKKIGNFHDLGLIHSVQGRNKVEKINQECSDNTTNFYY